MDRTNWPGQAGRVVDRRGGPHKGGPADENWPAAVIMEVLAMVMVVVVVQVVVVVVVGRGAKRGRGSLGKRAAEGGRERASDEHRE